MVNDQAKKLSVDDLLYTVRFKADTESHLVIISHEACKKCVKKQCVNACPANVYKWEEEKITVNFEGCLECGTCRVVCCEFNNISWRYPRGGFGVSYKYG
jgi:ferredoxin like protein